MLYDRSMVLTLALAAMFGQPGNSSPRTHKVQATLNQVGNLQIASEGFPNPVLAHTETDSQLFAYQGAMTGVFLQTTNHAIFFTKVRKSDRRAMLSACRSDGSAETALIPSEIGPPNSTVGAISGADINELGRMVVAVRLAAGNEIRVGYATEVPTRVELPYNISIIDDKAKRPANPKWSPDGTRFAFENSLSGDSNNKTHRFLYMYNFNGLGTLDGRVDQLTGWKTFWNEPSKNVNTIDHRNPRFSQDGTRLFFDDYLNSGLLPRWASWIPLNVSPYAVGFGTPIPGTDVGKSVMGVPDMMTSLGKPLSVIYAENSGSGVHNIVKRSISTNESRALTTQSEWDYTSPVLAPEGGDVVVRRTNSAQDQMCILRKDGTGALVPSSWDPAYTYTPCSWHKALKLPVLGNNSSYGNGAAAMVLAEKKGIISSFALVDARDPSMRQSAVISYPGHGQVRVTIPSGVGQVLTGNFGDATAPSLLPKCTLEPVYLWATSVTITWANTTYGFMKTSVVFS